MRDQSKFNQYLCSLEKVLKRYGISHKIASEPETSI